MVAVLRAMTTDDIPAVQAVEVAAGELFRSVAEPRIATCADHSPMPAAALREFVDEGRAWVAVEETKVVGFLVARVLDGCGHVEEVAVDPAFGRRGHATALLDRAAEWATDNDLAALTLTTFTDVPWNRPFYERRGFDVIADEDMPPAFVELVVEEDERYGLARDLRVVMRKRVRPSG